jgi:glycosyltransferase involved in cell wall biosynthesis
MSDDAVDVLLPTHARPHTIGSAIAAVLAQTHARFSLHVVGDGCDEATAALVADCRDARVRLHRFPKARGFGYANRNQVLRASTAPFVAYANDDDLWFPDHLERGLALLQEARLDLVAFRSIHVAPPDTLDPHFFAFDWHLGAAGQFLRHWFLGAGTLIHRRRVFDRVGYWHAGLVRFGDREFFNRARRSGLPFAIRDEVTVLRFYAQHWDHRYRPNEAPPQTRYLPRLADPHWRAQVRAAAAPGARPLAVRGRQITDFSRFALRSGPKFARFWLERQRAMDDPR